MIHPARQHPRQMEPSPPVGRRADASIWQPKVLLSVSRRRSSGSETQQSPSKADSPSKSEK